MLADFGLSSAIMYSNLALKTSAYTDLRCTPRWVSYELLAFLDDVDTEVKCTKASDLWAYGMVLYVCFLLDLMYVIWDLKTLQRK